MTHKNQRCLALSFAGSFLLLSFGPSLHPTAPPLQVALPCFLWLSYHVTTHRRAHLSYTTFTAIPACFAAWHLTPPTSASALLFTARSLTAVPRPPQKSITRAARVQGVPYPECGRLGDPEASTPAMVSCYGQLRQYCRELRGLFKPGLLKLTLLETVKWNAVCTTDCSASGFESLNLESLKSLNL